MSATRIRKSLDELTRTWRPVVLAIVVRLVWILLFAHEPAVHEATDPNAYLLIAQRAVAGEAYFRSPAWPFGHGGPTSYLSIAYPFLLGTASRLFGGTSIYAIGVVANLIASAVLVRTMQRWVTSLGGVRAGLVAALSVAVYPDLVTATSLLMTEVIGAALAVMTLRYLHEQRWLPTALSLAGLIWFRPGLQFVIVAVLAVGWRAMGWRRTVRLAAVAGALLLPLAYQSTVRVGAVGLSSATWINICDGSVPGAGGGFKAESACRIGSEESERDWVRASRDQALDQIGDRPLRYIGLVPLRLWETVRSQGWGVELAEHWSGSLRVSDRMYRSMIWLSNLAYIGLIVAAAVGAQRRWRAMRAGVIVALASLVGVMVAFGQPRYLATVVVVVLIPAAALNAGNDTIAAADNPAVIEATP